MRVFLVITVACVLAGAARGETLHVPQQFPTIQAALDAALAGDVVLVSSGVYPESVTKMLPAGVTIRAQGNARIDATGLGAALTLVGQDLQVTGLKVIGGTDGIRVGGNHALVTGCKVSDVTGRGFVVGGTHTKLDHCKVTRSGGDGIAVVVAVVAIIDHCQVIDAAGNGLSLDGGSNACFVFGGRILRPGLDGVANASGGGVVENLRIVQPAGRGVADTPPDLPHGNNYVFVDVVRPGTDGIFTGGGKLGIQSCTITKPGAIGLNVSATLALVQHNKVKSAGTDGLRIAGQQGQWDVNTSIGAAGNGFVLDNTGNTLTLNRGKGSDGFDLLDNHPGGNVIADDNEFGTVGP